MGSRRNRAREESQERTSPYAERRDGRVKQLLRRARVISKSIPKDNYSSGEVSSSDFENYLHGRDLDEGGLTRYQVPDPLVDQLTAQLDRSFSPSFKDDEQEETLGQYLRDTPSGPVRTPDIEGQVRQATLELEQLKRQILEAKRDEIRRSQEFERLQEAARQEEKLEQMIMEMENNMREIKKQAEEQEAFERSYGGDVEDTSHIYVNNTQELEGAVVLGLEDVLKGHLADQTNTSYLDISGTGVHDLLDERLGTHDERMRALEGYNLGATYQLNPLLTKELGKRPIASPAFEIRLPSELLGLGGEEMRDQEEHQDGARGGTAGTSDICDMQNEQDRKMYYNQLYILRICELQKAKAILKRRQRMAAVEKGRIEDITSPPYPQSSPQPIPTAQTPPSTTLSGRSVGAIPKQFTPKLNPRKPKRGSTVENVPNGNQFLPLSTPSVVRENMVPPGETPKVRQPGTTSSPSYTEFIENLNTTPLRAGFTFPPFAGLRIDPIVSSSPSGRPAASTPATRGDTVTASIPASIPRSVPASVPASIPASATIAASTTTNPTYSLTRTSLPETQTAEHLPPPGYKRCGSRGEVHLNEINRLKMQSDCLLSYVASSSNIDREHVYRQLEYYLDEWQRIKDGLNEVSRADILWEQLEKTFKRVRQVHKSIASLLRVSIKKVDSTCQSREERSAAVVTNVIGIQTEDPIVIKSDNKDSKKDKVDDKRNRREKKSDPKRVAFNPFKYTYTPNNRIILPQGLNLTSNGGASSSMQPPPRRPLPVHPQVTPARSDFVRNSTTETVTNRKYASRVLTAPANANTSRPGRNSPPPNDSDDNDDNNDGRQGGSGGRRGAPERGGGGGKDSDNPDDDDNGDDKDNGDKKDKDGRRSKKKKSPPSSPSSSDNDSSSSDSKRRSRKSRHKRHGRHSRHSSSDTGGRSGRSGKTLSLRMPHISNSAWKWDGDVSVLARYLQRFYDAFKDEPDQSSLSFLRTCIPSTYFHEVDCSNTLKECLTLLSYYIEDSQIHSEKIYAKLRALPKSNSLVYDRKLLADQIILLKRGLDVSSSFWVNLSSTWTFFIKYFESTAYERMKNQMETLATQSGDKTGTGNYAPYISTIIRQQRIYINKKN